MRRLSRPAMSGRLPAAQFRLVPALGEAAPGLEQLARLGPGHDDLVGHAEAAAWLLEGLLFGTELAGALLAEQGLLGRPLQLHAARAALPQEDQIRRAWGELAVTLELEDDAPREIALGRVASRQED